MDDGWMARIGAYKMQNGKYNVAVVLLLVVGVVDECGMERDEVG